MPHRAHLFSLRIAHAFRETCLQPDYSWICLKKDILAGVTLGIIAIPLSMALAIASGVPPHYGLYTAIVAGFIIALTGGSRFSISGPTAAFVVVLFPITQKYGMPGLMMASALAGILLILMAFFRLGRFIEYIPEPVTLGFTAGIAVVIATLQMKDLLGINQVTWPDDYHQKVAWLIQHLPDWNIANLVVGLSTLLILILWPKWVKQIPPHLPAIALGSALAYGFNLFDIHVETIQDRFGLIWSSPDSFFQNLKFPWQYALPNGEYLSFSWSLTKDLILAGFTIAILGAIESLLCAVILDGMSGKRHSANSELLGQGLGNLVAPFLGGFAATAAIARSAANFRAGAQSPLAAIIHAMVVLFAIIFISSLLSQLPLAAMAGMLLVVAWNIAEFPKCLHLLKVAQKGDRILFLLCLFLTVFFDMITAITAGILIAAILFMKSMADITRLVDVSQSPQYVPFALKLNVKVFKITGPLFFAAADKVFYELTQYCQKDRVLILYLDNVHFLDAGGVSSLEKLIAHSKKSNTQLILTDIQSQPLQVLRGAHLVDHFSDFNILPFLQDALERYALRHDSVEVDLV